MAGRKPKPVALKIIEGNPGNRPLNQNEPQPDLATDVCDVPPQGLSALARDAWAHYTPILRNCGLLTVADIPALTMLCEHWALWRESLEAARAEGSGNRGPARLNVERDAKIVQSMLADFGMNPSVRSRIHVQSPDNPDPMRDFLFGK